ELRSLALHQGNEAGRGRCGARRRRSDHAAGQAGQSQGLAAKNQGGVEDIYKDSMDTEKRLMDVELKLVAQDDLLDELNKTVYRQQQKIDELEALCIALAKRLKETSELVAANAATAPINERPPHY